MNSGDGFKCISQVLNNKKPCQERECRYWLDFPDDYNCTHICIQKHGSLKLQQIGDRLKITAARVKQIEQESLKKMSKNKAILRIQE